MGFFFILCRNKLACVTAVFTPNDSPPGPGPGLSPPGPTPGPTPAQPSNSKTTYIIIGAVVGAVVLAALVTLTIFLLRRRQRLRAAQSSVEHGKPLIEVETGDVARTGYAVYVPQQ